MYMLHGFWGQKYWVDASTSYKKVCERRPPPSMSDYTPDHSDHKTLQTVGITLAVIKLFKQYLNQ